MKFIANHTVQVGKAPNVKTIEQGQTLPKLPVDELMRLQDLDAITGVDEPAPAAPAKSADEIAAEKAAAEKAAAAADADAALEAALAKA